MIYKKNVRLECSRESPVVKAHSSLHRSHIFFTMYILFDSIGNNNIIFTENGQNGLFHKA